MSPLILIPTCDSRPVAPLDRFASVKQSPNRQAKKRRLRTRLWLKSHECDKLLDQLELCYEELDSMIMAELEERERINRELREKVHKQLDIARELIKNFNGTEAQKKCLSAQHNRFEGLVSDRNKRLKSDNLRKLLHGIGLLIEKAGTEKVVELSISSISSTPKDVSSTTTIGATSGSSSPVESGRNDSISNKETKSPPVTEQSLKAAKRKQRAQIPWRTPTRLEFEEKPQLKPPEDKRNQSVTNIVAPVQQEKPERLALRYKTKKRSAEEPLSLDENFKKPFPINTEQLFQRRHQLPPAAQVPVLPPPLPRVEQSSPHSRDPRNNANYCNRGFLLQQNRARFESQNQQYFRVRGAEGSTLKKPTAAAHLLVTPKSPEGITSPTVCADPHVQPSIRKPPAPRASVAPNVSRRSPSPVAVSPSKPEVKKTINPVYTNDEPIKLGKKEPAKKSAQVLDKISTVTSKSTDVVPSNITVENNTTKSVKPNEQLANTSKKTTSEQNSNSLEENIMEMLKELGDEEKVKQILDVMSRKSDDDAEKHDEQIPKPIKEKKVLKKTKRSCSRASESSSEDESPQKSEESKKEKSKPTKRSVQVNREVCALLENSSDWMAKGDTHYAGRRRQQLPPQNVNNNAPKRLSTDSSPTDDTIPKQDDPLLTVAKCQQVIPPGKGKQKNKEINFVYNDKNTVHFNSNYSSNCALCSFNGSAIVDHYVYEHKQYEVFVSRVSPKMAELIRADPFITNGTLLSEDTSEEKIRFNCYFCLGPKELSRAEWTNHLAAHTGEYFYRCTSCPVMSRTEELSSSFFHDKSCLKPILALYNKIAFEDNHLYGYICDACNYIQIRRVNMERHLKREHPSADVTCSRFSIVNHKIETKPVIDEEQLMMASCSKSTGLSPLAAPLKPKVEPMEACEIVNQPVTDDEEMPDVNSPSPMVGVAATRTSIRLQSVHIGSVGAIQPNRLGHIPFSIKVEQELQENQITTSGGLHESPMSPEIQAATNDRQTGEAQAVVPILQIQSIQGGFDLNKVFVKKESEADCASDESDATVDFNMSDPIDECGLKQAANDGGHKESSASAINKSGTSASGGVPSGSGGNVSGGSSGSSSGGTGAGGAGGDGGDDRKRESFPIPFQIKVEKEDEDSNDGKKTQCEETDALHDVTVKTEKDGDDEGLTGGADYDFMELVLDSTRIEHVAFVEHQSQLLFLCLVPGCQYVGKDPENITQHISRKHNQVIWDGYCHPCQSQIIIADNCSISNELQHLLDVHARRKTPPLEITDVRSTATNVIRIRKMPGDTLSAGEPNLPPLMPILPEAQSPVVITLPSTTTVSSFKSPLIIKSAATLAPIPSANLKATTTVGSVPFTPTHTIPAQIRPISMQAGPSNAGLAPNLSSQLALAPVTDASIVPSLSVMHVSPVRLKPWIGATTMKTQEHCRSMLEEISLLSLYKCMGKSCAFTTNNRLFMVQHLALHSQVVSQSNYGRKCWLECAYCALTASTSDELVTHIDVEHASDGFQCNLCFYRARDPTNVVVHQKTYHPDGKNPKNILIMPDNLKSFGDDEWRAMQESLRKNVLPLFCTVCKDSYYILSSYMTHLTTHNQTYISCQVCNLMVDKKVMARHLLMHSIGLYECVYCLFGANTKSTMAVHVCNTHSSKPLYCCVRYNKKRPDGLEYPPNKIESMELKTMSCTVSPDLFKRCSYTEAQLNYKPVCLITNQTMAYQRTSTVTKSATPTAATPASNIQIQITDEAGRPLIISIPVQNSGNVSSQPTASSAITGNSMTIPASVAKVAAPAVSSAPVPFQMPMISTVQGGVKLPPVQQAPLPIISSVQGMVALPPPPPLAVIQPRADGLPVISSVQSVAQLPLGNIHKSLEPTSSHPTSITLTSKLGGPPTTMVLPRNVTVTYKPAASAVGTGSVTSSSAVAVDARVTASSGAGIDGNTMVDASTPGSSASGSDMYTTTVAEADTQSNNADFAQESSEGTGSKCSTPVHSQSPTPTSTEQVASSTTTTTASTAPKRFSSTTQIRIDFLFNGSIEKFDRLERKVSEMIRSTGFCGQELNACGVEKCNSRYSDPVKLNLHLLKHHNVSSYKCAHCPEKFKTAHELITHIKTHGRHRYLCFMCEKKSHFLKLMILHVQHDHNSADVILTYLHPKKRDIHNDLVVICPQSVTQNHLQEYINRILEDTPETGRKYAPSEVDQIPMQEIFTENLHCANCDYMSKIRKNFKRHLERHLELPQSAEATEVVPAIAEDTARKMSESTINLASTSTSNSTTDDVIEIDPSVSCNIPQHVDPAKLYQCGICKYDCPPLIGALRSHLYRFHRHEKVYKCPHCKLVVNDGFICIDKIVNHLKLHGERLYKCSKCDCFRDQRYLIIPHIKQNHCDLTDAATVQTIREPCIDPEWQCDLCETVRPKRAEMVEHMTKDHKLTDHQYKCTHCAYKSSDNDSFKDHFAKSHPGSNILIISLFHELPRERKSTGNDTPSVAGDVDSNIEETTNMKTFSCGFESCTYISTNLQQTKAHFLKEHPDQSLVVYDDSGITRNSRNQFDYFIKYMCNNCQDVKCETVDDLIEHWYQHHKGDKNPLMFKLLKLVRCFYCDKLATYQDIKTHTAAKHVGQLFACVDHQNVFKCGECPHIFSGDSGDLLKHFKIYHSSTSNLIEDPGDYIDDEFLHRMLEQNNYRYRCNHCRHSYDTRYEYENHIDICAFAGLPSSFELVQKSVRIRYLCNICGDMSDTEYSIAAHMRIHVAQYNCRYCRREFKELKHLDQHQVELHNASDDTFLLKNMKHHRSSFTQIKMLFPNGLVLSKADAHRTVCGSVEDIMNFVSAINDSEMAQLMLARSLKMPLEYEDEFGNIVQTICKEFLANQPTKMVLELENLDDFQIAQVREQAFLLYKATHVEPEPPVEVKRNPVRRRRYKRVTVSDSSNDDDDVDWQPQSKLCMTYSARPRKTVVDVKRERRSSSSSDDELLIHFKKLKRESNQSVKQESNQSVKQESNQNLKQELNQNVKQEFPEQELQQELEENEEIVLG